MARPAPTTRALQTEELCWLCASRFRLTARSWRRWLSSGASAVGGRHRCHPAAPAAGHAPSPPSPLPQPPTRCADMLHLCPTCHSAGGPCNDMLMDEASGLAWVGNFGFDLFAGADPTPTQLAVVDTAAWAAGTACPTASARPTGAAHHCDWLPICTPQWVHVHPIWTATQPNSRHTADTQPNRLQSPRMNAMQRGSGSFPERRSPHRRRADAGGCRDVREAADGLRCGGGGRGAQQPAGH